MISFLSEFNQNIYEPWRVEYVAFEAIFNGLKEVCDSGHWTSKDEEDFESAIRLEAAKVDLFISRKQRDIESTLLYCQRMLSQPESMDKAALDSTDDMLTDTLADINDLTKFTRLNFRALEKLIQEHDKLTNTNRRSLLVEVCRTRPLDSQRFDGTLVQVSSLLDNCRLLTSNKKKTKKPNIKRDFSTARYWVHQDNVTEVKSILLFNLPVFGNDSYQQTERSISYIYLDNDSFDEYTAQLQCDNGAELITCRWDGDIESTSQVFIEKHVFVKGGPSTQDDAIPVDKHRLHDFIATQTYSAKEYAQGLKKAGFDQDYVESSYALAKSIQESIIDKHLKPKLRIRFTRLLFEAPHDKAISVSLDTDVTLNVITSSSDKASNSSSSSKEWLRGNDDDDGDGITEKSTLFPHAILQVNILDENPPVWLSRLLESKLVFEVPRFSICLHGVALFWSPQLPLLPWWLSQIDIDIHTAKQQDKLLVEGASEYYSGLTRPIRLRPLIDGHYRMGYLEAQLQKQGHPQRRRPQSIAITTDVSVAHSQENGVQLDASNHFSDFYQPRQSQAAYMLQDPHTIKQSDQIRKSMLVELGQEKEQKKKDKKKNKKNKPPQHTMEPKLFFANERTFINWLQFSALIMTAALTLLNFGDSISTVAGATFFGISMVIALYATFRHRLRSHQMSTRPHLRYDDLYGPVGLCCLLLGAIALNFALRWQHPSSSDTYLGVNNKTDEQSNNNSSNSSFDSGA